MGYERGGPRLTGLGKSIVIIGILLILIVVGFITWPLYGPTVIALLQKPEAPVLVSTPITSVSTTQAPTPAIVSPGVTPAETGGEYPEVVVGFDSFASYDINLLIKELDLDHKYGFELGMIPFCLTDDNCFSEAERTVKMSSGEWDIMLTTLDKIALAPEVGKITAFVDETDGADKLVVNPELISTINDLRGKRISFMEGSVGEYFVYYLLNLVQIAPNEVELYPAEDVIAATEMYTNGWVDAVSGWEPDVDAALDAGGEVLIDSGRLRVVVDITISSNHSINERSELVQAYHNAWFEALKFQFDNPDDAEQLVIDWGHNDWSYIAAPGDMVGWLETIAQAGLGSNKLAMSDFVSMGTDSLVAERLNEAKKVWQWAGKVVEDVPVEEMVAPQFVLASAENPNLQPMTAPINDTFLLTATPDIPQLSEEELGGATTLAVLPLRKIEFEPDSTRLTEKAQRDLREQVLPVLRSSTTLYLKIEGSAAWPCCGKYTAEQIQNFAYRRALSTVQFLTNSGIDPDRFILGTIVPQFPESNSEVELEQDRYVQFTLIKPLGW
jgi:hypothetical protein